MDLNLPLLLLAGFSSLGLAFRSGILKPRSWDWFAVACVVLVAGGVTALVAFDVAGLVAFALWALFVLCPILLSRLQARLLMTQRYDAVYAAGWVLALLHPSKPFRANVARVRALRAAAAGDRTAAERALDAYAAFGAAAAAEARLERVRLGVDPDEVRTAVLALEDARTARGPVVAFGMVRALAEIGDLPGAIGRYRLSEPLFEPEPAEALRTSGCLVLFAATGRVADVDVVLGARLRPASSALKDFWRACALYAAGDPDGERALRGFAGSTDGLLRRGAIIRLASPRFSPEQLTPADITLLDRLALRITQEDRFRFGSRRRTVPWVCHGLALVTALVFVLGEVVYFAERSRGISRERVLEQMGALSATAVIEGGEYWRLVAPLFLHYGAAHAIFNLLGLYFLGPFVERALGRERFLLTYFGSGLAGTVLYVLRAQYLTAPDDFIARHTILVGASGAIMGLLGATIAVLARGALGRKIPAARRRLAIVGMILVLQMVFDQLIAQISSFAHTVGALAGLALGFLLSTGDKRR
ncbi:MAG: rhomboid family intramembrane serine protease [Myxococcales bacterium]|nr:rhomboid family intramembrane serine protease [Myxococcales bacterium]